MNKKNLAIVIIIALIAGAAAGAAVTFILEDGDNGEQDGTTATVNGGTNSGTVTAGTACTEEAMQCPDGSYVGRVPPDCEFEQCPELPPVQQAENIRVYEPSQGSDISSPVTISGEARVFEGTVNYRVRDNNGNIIGEGFATAAMPDVGQFGPFSVAATFSTPATGIGKIEVFNLSARDGSIENLVTVRVRFAPGG